MNKRLWVLLLMIVPAVAIGIGSAKRQLNLPGFASDRLLYVGPNNNIDDSAIVVGGATDDELSGIGVLTVDNLQMNTNTLNTSSGDLNLDANGAVNLGGGGTIANLLEGSPLRFQDQTGGEYIAFQPPTAVTSSTTFTLPDGDGNNGQAIVTDGSGALSWGNAGASSNYIYFDDFEADEVSNVSEYNDGASATPTDLTGGTPVDASSSSETTNPLSGDASYLLSKAAADGQGEGWAITTKALQRFETVGPQNITISFDYETSANYASDDVTVWIYRVGSGTLESCSGLNFAGSFSNQLKASPDGASYSCVFSVNSSDTSVRIGLHIATTNASAYDVVIDRIQVSTATQIPVPIMTNAEDCTPSYSGFTANAVTAKCRRDGQFLEVWWSGNITGATTLFAFNPPSGYSVDESALNTGTNGIVKIDGGAIALDVGTAYRTGEAHWNTTNNAVYILNAGGSSPWQASGSPHVWASGDDLSIYFKVPIEQYASSNATMSTTAVNNQPVLANCEVTSSTANSSFADITYETIDFDNCTEDTHDAVTTGASWVFTAPVPGRYKVCGLTGWGSANDLQQSVTKIRVNGSDRDFIGGLGNATATTVSNIQSWSCRIIALEQGDTLDVQAYQDSNPSAARVLATGSSFKSFISIERKHDFSTFGVYGVHEILSATSSVKTPSGSSHFHNHTNNELVLTSGTFRLLGYAEFANNGSGPGYSNALTFWGGSDGADNGTNPATLGTVSGLTVISDTSSDYQGTHWVDGISSAVNLRMSTQPLIVRCASSCTVYLNTFSVQTTSSNARITVYPTAERLQ